MTVTSDDSEAEEILGALGEVFDVDIKQNVAGGAAAKKPRPAAPKQQVRNGPSIDDIELEDILAVIRSIMDDEVELQSTTAITIVARELGFTRTGQRIHDTVKSALTAAVRRGIIINNRGTYSIDCRRITDYPDDLLDKCFYAAIGRSWWERDEAIRAAARYLGFRRTGSVIVETFEKVIRRGLRRKELEKDGGVIRRVK
jgi:hypothetical protein